MTTIAYSNGIIAVDGFAVAGDTITDSDLDKSFVDEGVYFVVCGVFHDAAHIIDAYHGREHDKEADISALIDDNGKVYVAGFDEGKFWKLDITGRNYAAGSGSDHALTALDMGCTARKAVAMAAKRDVNTGGKIRSHKVRSGN